MCGVYMFIYKIIINIILFILTYLQFIFSSECTALHLVMCQMIMQHAHTEVTRYMSGIAVLGICSV